MVQCRDRRYTNRDFRKDACTKALRTMPSDATRATMVSQRGIRLNITMACGIWCAGRAPGRSGSIQTKVLEIARLAELGPTRLCVDRTVS